MLFKSGWPQNSHTAGVDLRAHSVCVWQVERVYLKHASRRGNNISVEWWKVWQWTRVLAVWAYVVVLKLYFLKGYTQAPFGSFKSVNNWAEHLLSAHTPSPSSPLTHHSLPPVSGCGWHLPALSSVWVGRVPRVPPRASPLLISFMKENPSCPRALCCLTVPGLQMWLTPLLSVVPEPGYKRMLLGFVCAAPL